MLTAMKPGEETVLDLQLSSAIQQYQFFFGQLIQSIGFLVAADALLLGYGINSHASGALLLATLMPLFMLLVRIEFGRNALVAAYVAIQLERQLGISADTLMSTQIAARFPTAYAHLTKIINIEDPAVRISAIRDGMRRRNAVKDSDTVVFLGAATIQFGLFLFALIGLGRPLL
jgi:hypothetical protein